MYMIGQEGSTAHGSSASYEGVAGGVYSDVGKKSELIGQGQYGARSSDSIWGVVGGVYAAEGMELRVRTLKKGNPKLGV